MKDARPHEPEPTGSPRREWTEAEHRAAFEATQTVARAQERVVLTKHLMQAMTGLEQTPLYLDLFRFLMEQHDELQSARQRIPREVD
jgi:hypothetical protein